MAGEAIADVVPIVLSSKIGTAGREAWRYEAITCSQQPMAVRRSEKSRCSSCINFSGFSQASQEVQGRLVIRRIGIYLWWFNGSLVLVGKNASLFGGVSCVENGKIVQS